MSRPLDDHLYDFCMCYLSLPLGQLYDARDFALFTVISQKLELCLAQSRYHMTIC